MKFIFFILFTTNLIGYAQVANCDDIEYINGKFCSNDKKPFTGDCISYYSTGKKSFEGSFQNGYVFGPRKWYYDNGQISQQMTYEEDHINSTYEINGKVTRWFKNGKIKQVVNYKFGKLHGDWYEFDVKGKKIKKGSYKDNVLLSGDHYIEKEI